MVLFLHDVDRRRIDSNVCAGISAGVEGYYMGAGAPWSAANFQSGIDDQFFPGNTGGTGRVGEDGWGGPNEDSSINLYRLICAALLSNWICRSSRVKISDS